MGADLSAKTMFQTTHFRKMYWPFRGQVRSHGGVVNSLLTAGSQQIPQKQSGARSTPTSGNALHHAICTITPSRNASAITTLS
ncbi:hypothetical protein F4W67_20945 [Pseudomonas caricapapayae]|nr:hypothetical protein F4W67_20945 [Pseudomonas caricapapayae]